MTKYQIEIQQEDGAWTPTAEPFDSMVSAEMFAIEHLWSKITRVVPVSV